LEAVEKKPRIECFRQSVALTTFGQDRLLGRPIISRIFALLLSAGGVLVSARLFLDRLQETRLQDGVHEERCGRLGLSEIKPRIEIWTKRLDCATPAGR
jgi:hypothetical protein